MGAQTLKSPEARELHVNGVDKCTRLMAHPLDEGCLAASRGAGAEVEEPAGRALQKQLQLSGLLRPVYIGHRRLQNIGLLMCILLLCCLFGTSIDLSQSCI